MIDWVIDQCTLIAYSYNSEEEVSARNCKMWWLIKNKAKIDNFSWYVGISTSFFASDYILDYKSLIAVFTGTPCIYDILSLPLW